jgi:hypothetical protein
MKIILSISLILVSATSYVQSDGHGHHGHHGHHDHHDYQPYHAYERQSSGYDAPDPQPSYGAPAPAPSYGAPAAAPEPSYGAPAPSYDTPSTGYDSPSTGYGCGDGYGRQGCEEEDSFPDLTPFLALSLVILGLSLLFPAILTIDNVNTNTNNNNMMMTMPAGKRKRRFADEDQASRTNFVGRSIEIYNHLNAALEPVDKNCVEKITCEVGSLARDAGLTQNAIFRLAGGFIPYKYKTYYKHFVYGDNCHKIKCGEF